MKHVWLVALTLMGCHEAVSPVPDEASTKQELSQIAPGVSSPEVFEVERATKEAWSTPTQVTPVDWAEVSKHTPIAANVLSAEESQKIQGLGLPVLLPADSALASTANVVTGENWYTASMQHDGVTVVIHGSTAAHNIDLNVPPETLELMRNFTVYRTHEILTLTFNMYGVAYGLDIECAKPTQDDRCNKDDTILQMAESLVLAGGQP